MSVRVQRVSGGSDDVQVAVAHGGRAERGRALAGEAAQGPQNHIGHVIRDHPRADQNIPERRLAGPLGAVSHLREAVSVTREMNYSFEKNNWK